MHTATLTVTWVRLFCLHITSYAPAVPLDLNDALDALAPESKQYRHWDEGSDDVRASGRRAHSLHFAPGICMRVTHAQPDLAYLQHGILACETDHGSFELCLADALLAPAVRRCLPTSR